MTRTRLMLLLAIVALAPIGCRLTAPVQLPPGEHESGRDFLVGTDPEAEGYGLYSYLLFGQSPTEATRPRYLSSLSSYLGTVLPISSMEAYLPREQLNVTYLPVTERPPSWLVDLCPGPDCGGEKLTKAAGWLLDHYNYARARVILRAVPGTNQDGPYIVSYAKPLTTVGKLQTKYLRQDLSLVPPELVHSWVKEFLVQSAREHYWQPDHLKQFALRLRTAIASTGTGWKQVQASADRLIKWVE